MKLTERLRAVIVKKSNDDKDVIKEYERIIQEISKVAEWTMSYTYATYVVDQSIAYGVLVLLMDDGFDIVYNKRELFAVISWNNINGGSLKEIE